MRTVPGLAQIEQRPPRYHFTPVANEGTQYFLQVEQAWLPFDNRDHVDAKNALHRCLLVQIVQDDLRHLSAPKLDDHAHTVLVGLIPQFGNALEFLFFDQFGNFFQQAGLVHLVRKFRDDDRLFAV